LNFIICDIRYNYCFLLTFTFLLFYFFTFLFLIGTVYIKGAEVIKGYYELLGEAGFKKGLKLYIDRHDGQAVTCDDFRAAMADANNEDLSQFERWYSQAGTPIITVTTSYDASNKKFSLTLSQHQNETPGQPAETKEPLMIPVSIGLLSRTTMKDVLPNGSITLRLTERKQTFEFDNITENPVLSIFRGFSSPVKIKYSQGSEQISNDLAFLMAHDSDSFNRWDAGNRLQTELLLDLVKTYQSNTEATLPPLPKSFIDAMRQVITSCDGDGITSDHSLTAYAMTFPDDATLAQAMNPIDPDAIHAVLKHAQRSLAKELKQELETLYMSLKPKEDYEFTPQAVGRRKLRNVCLSYLTSTDASSDDTLSIAATRAMQQFNDATCMSDKVAGFNALVSLPSSVTERQLAIDKFYSDADGDALVLNKWFTIQALADDANQLEAVKTLKKHPDFTLANPNRARSLISAFATNSKHFHSKDGSGYEFIGDSVIEIDKLNPQVAARLAGALSQWRRYDDDRQSLMKIQLERIKATEGLSKDTYEVILRSLK
jgi:aminopeptidase N